MKIQKLRIVLALLWTVAAFGTGCYPYHRSRVGVAVDIHSKDYHEDDGDHHEDRHDNGHHRRNEHHEDDDE